MTRSGGARVCPALTGDSSRVLPSALPKRAHERAHVVLNHAERRTREARFLAPGPVNDDNLQHVPPVVTSARRIAEVAGIVQPPATRRRFGLDGT